MRRLKLLSVDMTLISMATLLSWAIRENFELDLERLSLFVPYMIATILSSSVIIDVTGLDRAVWRFFGRPDNIRLIWACLATIVAALAITFAYNRLEGVARSLPFLQFLACTAFLMGARAFHKTYHDMRRYRRTVPGMLKPAETNRSRNVLVAGVSRLTKVYLQAIDEFAPGRVRIAGLLANSERHVGRLVATHPVIGTLGEVTHVLDRLEVHGVSVDQIIVASSFEALSKVERDALLYVELSRGLSLRFLEEGLGLLEEGRRLMPALAEGAEPIIDVSRELCFQIDPHELEAIRKRGYWAVKRALDFACALTLIIATAPFMLISAVIVAGSVGFPILFWQQRPGLGGRPFRLYKFRTMRAGHTASGRRLTDRERVSRIGTLMRRFRLDEFPQLFNILRGDMCFIGPRPLLATDQSDAHRARLLVRPGLSGWAQVVGGRDISPDDKAALDIWYVKNASLMLDFQIFARTGFMIVFGERVSRPLIEKAWRDLRESGILRGEPARKNTNYETVRSYAA